MRFSAFVRLLATLLAVTMFSWPLTVRAADTSLWDIVSPLIPDDAKGVFYVDGASVKSSAVFNQLKPTLFGMQHGTLDGIEKTCDLDLAASFSNALVVISPKGDPICYVETNGLNLKRITACINALVKREMHKVKVTPMGSIVEVATGSEKNYFGWISGKVAVFIDKSRNRERLSKALTKARKRFDAMPNVKTQFAEINRTATLWGLLMDLSGLRESEKSERLQGSVNLAVENATADVRGSFVSADNAAAVANKLNEELARAKEDLRTHPKLFGGATPAVLRLLGAVNIVCTGNEVTGAATTAQSDIVDIANAIIAEW